jgi:hypothetical protein
VAIGTPVLVLLLYIFGEYFHLVITLMSLIVGVAQLASTLLGKQVDEVPPASPEFLSAADPARPLPAPPERS